MVKKMIFSSIVLFSQLSFAASFDCTKAGTAIEMMICSNPQLSVLDDTLSNEYLSLLNRSSFAIKKSIVVEQRQWLKSERNICRDQECLELRYRTRLEAIKQKHFDTKNTPFIRVNIFDVTPPPIGKGYPSAFEQSDGDLVYSHYDETGNSKNLVQFDFTTGRWVNLLTSQKDPKLIAQNQKYIIYHVPHSASYPVKVMDRETGKHLSGIRLKKPVFNAFIKDNLLILFQTGDRTYNNRKQAISIFSLPSLKLIKETTILGAHLLGISDNYIYTSISEINAQDLIIYDHKLNEVKRLTFPKVIEKINSGCSSYIKQGNSDRAVLVTHCGEMHIINLKSFSIENSIPRFSHFYSMALHEGLIFAVGKRHETDSDNPVIVYDMLSGKNIASLPINTDFIAIKGNILLAADRPAMPGYGKKPYWPMSTYAIDVESIRNGNWQVKHTLSECQRANNILHKSGSIYDAISTCKAAGIEKYAADKIVPDIILPILRQYALWLSSTLDKNRDAIRLLERLSIVMPDSEIASALLEAKLKHTIIDDDSTKELSTTELNTKFGQLLVNGRTIPSAATKSIEFGAFPNLFHFSDDRIYVGRYGCTTRNCASGTAIGIFDRNTLNEIGTIPIAQDSDMYQDNVSSIATDESNIYASVDYRYHDDGLKEGRPNFFIIGKNSLKITQKIRLPQMGRVVRDSGKTLLCECSFSSHNYCAVIDPSNLDSLHKSEKQCLGSVSDEVEVYKFTSQENANPTVMAFTKSYVLTHEGKRGETFYGIYDRTGNKTGNITTKIPNRINWHMISDSNDLLVTKHENNIGGIKFILVSLPSGSIRDLFALPAGSRSPAIVAHKQTLYVGYGRDLLVFDLSTNHLTRYINDFVPSGFNDNGHGVDTNKIVRLIIDQGRLIALTFRGNNCRIAKLTDL